jgi:hypothetical protein
MVWPIIFGQSALVNQLGQSAWSIVVLRNQLGRSGPVSSCSVNRALEAHGGGRFILRTAQRRVNERRRHGHGLPEISTPKRLTHCFQ